MNIAQWQGWTTLVVSFNLAEPVSHRALTKNILKGNTNQDKGGKNKQWQNIKEGRFFWTRRACLVLLPCVCVLTHTCPGDASDKEPACQRKRHKFDPLEEDMVTHSSILAWRIPWTEEPGGLQSTGLHGDGHNWSDLAHTHTHAQIFIYFKIGKVEEVYIPIFCPTHFHNIFNFYFTTTSDRKLTISQGKSPNSLTTLMVRNVFTTLNEDLPYYSLIGSSSLP